MQMYDMISTLNFGYMASSLHIPGYQSIFFPNPFMPITPDEKMPNMGIFYLSKAYFEKFFKYKFDQLIDQSLFF